MMSANDQEKHYLKKGGLVVICTVLGGYFADYLFNIVLSRQLPQHEYGDYKVAYAFVAIVSVLCLLGGDRIAPRILSEPLARNDNRPVWGFLLFYGLLALTVSVMVIIALAIGAYLHLGKVDLQDHHPFLMISFAIPFIVIGALLSRVLQSGKYLAYSNLPWRIILPLLKLLLIGIVLLIKPRLVLWQVIVIGIVSAALIVYWQWKKVLSFKLLDFSVTEKINARESLKSSLSMMFAMLVILMLNQLDIFMLEALAQEHEVGIYAAASTSAHILLVVQTSIAALFIPLFSAVLATAKKAQSAHLPEQLLLLKNAQGLFWQTQKSTLLAVVLIATLLTVFGKVLLGFFGDTYTQALIPFRYLVFAYALWAASAFVSTWLQYHQRESWVLMIGSLTLVVNAMCNYYLIPSYGIAGAAWATAMALIISSILSWLAFIYLKGKLFSLRAVP